MKTYTEEFKKTIVELYENGNKNNEENKILFCINNLNLNFFENKK